MRKVLVAIIICLVIAGVLLLARSGRRQPDQLDRLMTLGAGYLEKGDATNAIVTYEKAEKRAPESIDVHLNLANAYLLSGNNQGVIKECQDAINLDHNN